MEELQAEIAFRCAKQRLVAPEADVAPGVEIQIGERFGERRDRRVERRGGEIARPLDDVCVAEGRRRVVLRQSGRGRQIAEAATTPASTARRLRRSMDFRNLWDAL